MATAAMMLGLAIFSFAVIIITRIFIFNDKFETWGYIFLAFMFMIALVGIIYFVKGLKNMLGKSKPIITLTPDGFIMPKGNRFIAWDLIAGYGVSVQQNISYVIFFNVGKTNADKNNFLNSKRQIFGTLFTKTVYRLSVNGIGFDGFTQDSMRELLGAYIDGAKARKKLATLNIKSKY